MRDGLTERNLYFRSTGTKMQLDEPEPCAGVAATP